jgi:alginate export protein
MRVVAIVIVMSVAHPLIVRGQSIPAGQSSAPSRNYHLLREDDDWRFLADFGERQDFWDPVKFIPLRDGRNDWFLSIGGEARGTWESITNNNWGQEPFTNSYLNQRYMFHVDAYYGTHVRSFVELKSGLNSGRTGGPRPIDEQKLDFQAAFLEAGTGNDRTSIKVRVGRHEMEYGSGRLIDVREGPNVRLSFDGVKVKSRIGRWQVDGFALRPALDKPGIFDDSSNGTVGFWGVYGVSPLTNSLTLDAYYLGLDRKTAAFNRGTGHEQRHSVGARVSRPVAQTKPRLDFDYEALWQFGSFGSANIRAWTVASETGCRLPTVPLKPRFSVKADISSGDDAGTHALGTFNALFPKGNYFGVLATTGPGPINFIDAHPRVEAALPRDVTVSFDWIFQWRESVQDGVYSVPGFLIVPAGKSDARFVGHRPGAEVRWQADRHLWFQADYGTFYAGRFVKESQPARNLKYGALWAGYKF